MAAARRGGVTPFNLIPVSNNQHTEKGRRLTHGARTPEPLARWLIDYLCPPGGTVLDPFSGEGTIPIVAAEMGRKSIGIEKMEKYHLAAIERWKARKA